MEDFVASSQEKVTCAIVRNHGWIIVPEGNTALNLLVLSTQVQSALIFASNGPYREHELGKIKIKFNHGAS